MVSVTINTWHCLLRGSTMSCAWPNGNPLLSAVRCLGMQHVLDASFLALWPRYKHKSSDSRIEVDEPAPLSSEETSVYALALS